MRLKTHILKHQEKIFPILDVALNGINYFFHIYCSWYLTQKNYGTLNSLLSLLAILLVTGITFQIFTAKEVSTRGVKISKIFQVSYVYIIFILGIYFVFFQKLLLIISPKKDTLVLIFIIFLLNLFLSIIRGIFQGKKEFLNLNLSFYAEVLSKVIVLIILLPYFKSIESILISILVGMVAGILHGAFKLGLDKVDVRYEKNMAPLIFRVSTIFTSNFFIYYFTSIDMIVVNYFLRNVSGTYAVMLRYSQIILFVSFSLITVFIPNLSSVKHSIQEFDRYVRKYFLLLIGVQFLLFIAYLTIFPFSISYVFGEEYLGVKNYMFKGAIMYIMLVNSFFIVNINIILDKSKYLILLFLGALSLTILLLNFNTSISQILYAGIAVYSILFTVLIINYISERQGIYAKIR